MPGSKVHHVCGLHFRTGDPAQKQPRNNELAGEEITKNIAVPLAQD